MKTRKLLLMIPLGVLAFYGAVSAVSDIFTDVPEDAWYAEAVYNLKNLGVIGGYSDGTFRGSNYVNRAEVAMMLNNYHEKVLLPLVTGEEIDDNSGALDGDNNSNNSDDESIDEDSNSDDNNVTADLGSGSFLRFLNLSHSAPALDVYIDDKLVVSAADFAETDDYFDIAPGSYVMELRESGDSSEDDALLTANLTMIEGQYRTSTISGDWMGAEAVLKTFNDDHTISDDNYQISVYHLSPDAETLDVFLGETILGNDMEYGEAVLGYVPGEETSRIIKVYNTTSEGLVAQDSVTTFVNGYTYNVFIIGKEDNTDDEEPIQILLFAS